MLCSYSRGRRRCRDVRNQSYFIQILTFSFTFKTKTLRQLLKIQKFNLRPESVLMNYYHYLPTSAVMFGPKNEVNFAYEKKNRMFSANFMFLYFLETTFDENKR